MERAFRSLKTTRLWVRPLYAYSEEHVRGRVFLCMPAYYVAWRVRRKPASERTPEGLPVQSLRTLPEHLVTLTLNRVTLTQDDSHEFGSQARKSPLKWDEPALLSVAPARIVASRLTVRKRESEMQLASIEPISQPLRK